MIQLELSSFTIIILTIVTIYYLFFHKTRKDRLLAKIGGPRPLPFFGNSLTLVGPKEDVLPKILAWCKTYGQRFITRYAGRCFFITWSASDAEVILGSQIHIEKGFDYDYLMPWLGTGLLTSKGKKWFTRRKLLTPTFHFTILEDFIPMINEHSVILVENLKKEFADREVGDISNYIARCTLDIICETAMGKMINAQHERDTDYINAVYRIVQLIQHRTISPWLQSEFIWKLTSLGRQHDKLLKILHGFTEQVIRERKLEFLSKSNASNHLIEIKAGAKKRLAFLDLLLEAQRKGIGELTDLDIREETDTFMFEGHDTVCAGIKFALYLLGCHLDVQIKAQTELNEIFGDDKKRPVTSQDMYKMKYLECCLKESLRLYPSVNFIERILNFDLILNDGTIVPAGMTALVFIYQLHRNPVFFSNPEKFDPDRFQSEKQSSSGRNHFAYVPFSAGPRNCIGQKFAMLELKIVVANVLRNFTIVSEVIEKEMKLLAEPILRPMNGIRVKLISRIT